MNKGTTTGKCRGYGMRKPVGKAWADKIRKLQEEQIKNTKQVK